MGSKTILICEDDQVIREALCIALRGFGFFVAGFASAEQAINQSEIDLRQFDVILTDYEMLGIKGDIFARQMRSLNAISVIILMSGTYRATAIDDAAGVQFLAKPFSVSTLLERMSFNPNRILNRVA